jgi:glycosyltransferase involved in cell wall biosynthesis
MPFISVIIPNYNHAQFLKQRIESVIHQTFEDFELIILDDGSTDESREIIESYRGHLKISHIFYNQKNSGSVFKQWEKGILAAQGEWIWIAESDDFADTSFLQTLTEQTQEYPSAGIVHSNSYKENQAPITGVFKTTAEESNFDFATNKWDSDHLIKSGQAIDKYLKSKNIILNVSSALIKKKYITPLLPEIKNMNYYGDWYIYISIAANADIAYCSKLLNTFRRHPESVINKPVAAWKIKTDSFRILNLLLKQSHIINRADLVKDFTKNYLAAELKKDGAWNFINFITRCFFINPFLTIKAAIQITGLKLNKK